MNHFSEDRGLGSKRPAYGRIVGSALVVLALSLAAPVAPAQGQTSVAADFTDVSLSFLTCDFRDQFLARNRFMVVQLRASGPREALARQHARVMVVARSGTVGEFHTLSERTHSYAYLGPGNHPEAEMWDFTDPYEQNFPVVLSGANSWVFSAREPVTFKVTAHLGTSFMGGVQSEQTHVLSLNCDEGGGGAAPPTTTQTPSTPPPPTPPAEEEPLPDYRITVEENPVTGRSYRGVTADGTSRLEFDVNLPGVSSLKVQPTHGRFENAAGEAYGETIPLNGRVVIYYRPPAYVDREWLASGEHMPEIPAPSGRSWWRAPRVAKDRIHMEFTDARGQVQTRDGEMVVARPPVVLVHGFLGDRMTWRDFVQQLDESGFGSRADDYYVDDENSSQNVRGQAMHLEDILGEERLRYAQIHVKMGKADLVTHSMGGLIARYYVNGYEGYGDDVRKVIMIGTPNHGITRVFRNIIGRAGSLFYAMGGSGHSGMKSDVYYASAFLANLNRGENTGRHLRSGVQYGNIYSRMDDGVTTGLSANLQGVREVTLPQGAYHHSASVGTPTILEAGETRDAVARWLLNDIPLGVFTEWRIDVTPERLGDAMLRREDYSGGGLSFEETPLTTYHTSAEHLDQVRTGPNGRATVTWLLDGERFAQAILEPGSEIRLAGQSPWRVRAVMMRGSATFRSFKSPGVSGEIGVVLAAGDYGPQSYDLPITADLSTFGTTFAVKMDAGGWNVAVLEGEVEVEDARPGTAQPVRLGRGEATVLTPTTPARRESVAGGGWWTEALAWADRVADPVVAPPPGPDGPRPPTEGGVSMEDVYALESYAATDLQALGADITARAEAGFTPVGLAFHAGEVHVLYLGAEVMPITEWQLDWHDSTDELQAGINSRMNQGYLPNGFSWRDGRFYVLYVRTDFTGTAWQIVTSDVDLQAVNRDVQPWLAQDYVPFDVTLAQGRYMTLLVQLPEKIAEQWKLEGVYPDGMRRLIEDKLLSGYFPWGLLVDDVANVLFLGG